MTIRLKAGVSSQTTCSVWMKLCITGFYKKLSTTMGFAKIVSVTAVLYRGEVYKFLPLLYAFIAGYG